MRSYKPLLLTLLIGTAFFQPTLQQTQCVGKLDIIFVIDGSNSMGEFNFRSQMTSLNNLLNKLDISDAEVRVGIVIFSSTIQDNVALTGDKASLLARTFDYPDDLTRTDLAISAAVQNFNTNARGGDVPKLMMVITDGVSDDRALTKAAADAAKATGINIFAVGVTNGVDVDELRDVASAPDQVIITDDFAQLEQSLNDATNQACGNLGVTVPPPTVSPTPTAAPECASAKVDLAIVLDSSVTSITFNAFKEFLEGFLGFADVDRDLARVAVVTYSDNAQVRIGLNNNNNKNSLFNAIRNIQYTPGRSNPVSALTTLRQQVFTEANGDRSDVPNVVLFVTGTQANVNQANVASEALATRAEGIYIYTVGVGLGSAIELQSISNLPPSENMFIVPSPNDLTPTLANVFDKFIKFCQNPAPVPACGLGQRDLWLVVDTSDRVNSLSAQNFVGDYGLLKTGLNGMVNVINDDSVPNPNVRLGLITYSDSPTVNVALTNFNTIRSTSQAIAAIPNGVKQGSSRLAPALQAITAAPPTSTKDSYVVIVTSQNNPTTDLTTATTEAQRLKDLGWKVVTAAVADPVQFTNNGNWRDLASSPRLAFSLNSFTELDGAMRELTRDYLCGDERVITPTFGSLCANSGHVQDGVSTIAHPYECDKFVQCYFNPNGPNGGFDLAVVRNCPMGLFFNAQTKKCVKPENASCEWDRCKTDCEPYKMEGACGAYWACHDGMSVARCCPQFYSFVPGQGCIMDMTCKQDCGQENCTENGFCYKRPSWEEPAAYEVSLGGLNTWVPHPCLYKDFDIVDCDCSAPREQICEADREFDFTKGVTFDDPKCQGISLSEVDATGSGASFDKDSKMNIAVDPIIDEDGSMTLNIRFRESDNFNEFGAVLLSSDGSKCKHGGGSLIVSIENGFIKAKVQSQHGRMAVVQVPTEGIPRNAFKDLTLAYGNYYLALSVRGDTQQYVAQVEAPAKINFRCGLDIGGNLDKFGFEGIIEKLSVHSCLPPKLY